MKTLISPFKIPSDYQISALVQIPEEKKKLVDLKKGFRHGRAAVVWRVMQHDVKLRVEPLGGKLQNGLDKKTVIYCHLTNPLREALQLQGQ